MNRRAFHVLSTTLMTGAAGVALGLFSPADLFAASEPGGWYDPSDLTTLFQDAAGTTPVTAVEQPVGLVLDKSKGLVLGSELVTNGDFSNGTTGWTAANSASIAATSGELILTNTTAAYGIAYQAFTTVIGKTYKASCTARVISGNAASFQAATGVATGLIAETFTASSTATAISFVFTATSTTTYIRAILNNVDGYSAGYDNISVRELPGSHLSQSTSTARPVLSARVNTLTRTEEFDNAAWTKSNVTVSANAATAPDGTATADSLTPTAGSSFKAVWAGSLTNSGTNVFSVSVKSADQRYMQISRSGNADDYVNFDLQGVTASSYGSAIGSITASGDGWYRLTVTFPSLNNTTMFVGYADSLTFARQDVTASTNVVYIWGADLRPSNAGVGLPAYQRVGAATSGTSSAAGNSDYDTTGFPLYLKFDGTDDSLSSGSIDFTSTDKMSVFAGVRKIADTAIVGIIAELSADVDSNNGTFALLSTRFSSLANSSQWLSKGTSAASVNYDSFTTPSTRVFSCSGDIAGDAATLRQNGTVAGTSSADQGTGNLGNYPLYLGARGGTLYRFNGHLYSLIIRGALTDAATIASTETWVNQKTKAY